MKDASGGFEVQLSYTYAEPLSNAPFSVQVTDTASGATNQRHGIVTVTGGMLPMVDDNAGHGDHRHDGGRARDHQP